MILEVAHHREIEIRKAWPTFGVI